jgi:hypothetical protein
MNSPKFAITGKQTMKTYKLAVMALACAAAMPAFAQNTTDSRCGVTNYDRARDLYTIVRPNSNALNQQCFITVVPKSQWQGGANDASTSQFIEGNYQITLSGAGGGGGAGGTGGAGSGAQDANTSTVSRYLTPGVYRVTLGGGGMGGTGGTSGAGSVDGAPTSLSNARTGETVAGMAGAENFTGSNQARTGGAASGGAAASGTTTAGGDGGAKGSRNVAGASGLQGGAGFMKLALTDAVQPRAAAPAAAPIVQAAAPVQQAAPAYVEPAREPMRPARRDRN